MRKQNSKLLYYWQAILNYLYPHLMIIKHANEYVVNFIDKRREELISLLVIDKYFEMTNQPY